MGLQNASVCATGAFVSIYFLKTLDMKKLFFSGLVATLVLVASPTPALAHVVLQDGAAAANASYRATFPPALTRPNPCPKPAGR